MVCFSPNIVLCWLSLVVITDTPFACKVRVLTYGMVLDALS